MRSYTKRKYCSSTTTDLWLSTSCRRSRGSTPTITMSGLTTSATPIYQETKASRPSPHSRRRHLRASRRKSTYESSTSKHCNIRHIRRIPCDYAVFGPLKRKLRGQRFATLQDLQNEIRRILKEEFKREFYEKAIFDLKKRWQTVKCDGEYLTHSRLSAAHYEHCDK